MGFKTTLSILLIVLVGMALIGTIVVLSFIVHFCHDNDDGDGDTKLEDIFKTEYSGEETVNINWEWK